MSGLVEQSADARSKTIGSNFRVKAWGRIDESTLVASGGVSGISSSGTGAGLTSVITLSQQLHVGRRAVVTTGYCHEAKVVEGNLEHGTGSYTNTDSQITLIFEGNNSYKADHMGFAVLCDQ